MKRGFALILILVLITSIVGIGIVAYTKLKSKTNPIQSQVSLVPSPTPDPYADWQTFTNFESGITLQYPPDWSPHTQNPNDYSVSPNDLNIKKSELFESFFSGFQEDMDNRHATISMVVTTDDYDTVLSQVRKYFNVNAFGGIQQYGQFAGALYIQPNIYQADKDKSIPREDKDDYREHFVASLKGKTYWFQLSTNKQNVVAAEKMFRHLISSLTLIDELRTKIVFTKKGDIWTVDADGKNQKQLTTFGALFEPVLSPNGKYVAYLSIDRQIKDNFLQNKNNQESFDYKGVQIWIIGVDGTNPIRLTESNLGVSRKYLTWLPNSEKVLYDEGENIVVQNRNGSERKEIAKKSSIQGLLDSRPYRVISPDGTKLAVFKLANSAQTNPNTQLFIYDLNGKLEKSYNNFPTEIDAPYWLQDNKFYFLNYKAQSTSYELESMNTDGSQLKSNRVLTLSADELPPTEFFGVGSIAFSPDGKKIAGTVVTNNQSTHDEETKIWQADADGTNMQLLKGIFEGYPFSYPGIINKVKWTTDNKRFVFSATVTHIVDDNPSKTTQETALYIINSDGTDEKILDQFHFTNNQAPAILTDNNFSTGRE